MRGRPGRRPQSAASPPQATIMLAAKIDRPLSIDSTDERLASWPSKAQRGRLRPPRHDDVSRPQWQAPVGDSRRRLALPHRLNHRLSSRPGADRRLRVAAIKLRELAAHPRRPSASHRRPLFPGAENLRLSDNGTCDSSGAFVAGEGVVPNFGTAGRL